MMTGARRTTPRGRGGGGGGGADDDDKQQKGVRSLDDTRQEGRKEQRRLNDEMAVGGNRDCILWDRHAPKPASVEMPHQAHPRHAADARLMPVMMADK